MTQTNDPTGSRAPGFGASIGSNSDNNSTPASSPSAAETTKRDEAGEDKPRPRSRGGRRKKASGSGRGAREDGGDSAEPSTKSAEASTDSGGEAEQSGAGRRPSRSRSRSTKAKAEESNAASTDDTADGGEAQDKPRRRRSRGGRGRSRKSRDEVQEAGAGETESRAEESEPDDHRDAESRQPRTRRRKRGGRANSDSEGASESTREEDPTESPDAGGEDKPKRRRRGSRGGRGRTKKIAGGGDRPGAAVVEFIPGEDDDLPALPELPDEAELLNGRDIAKEPRGRGSKKKSRRRRAGSDESDEEDLEETRVTRKVSKIVPDRKILVNACDKEETRVAVVRNGMITDFQMNVESDTSLVNDIYRGRIVNIEASIGAAFVDFGRGRNGFLHTSDVLPTYADAGTSLTQLLATSVDPEDWDESSSQPGVAAELSGDQDSDDEDADGDDEASEEGGKKKAGRRKRGSSSKKGGRSDKGRQKRFRSRPRLPITKLFKVGQKVVVQITKDAIGDKGPTLTTYLSIPGRYLVLMPSISHCGVSRKIEDSKERKRLKRILDSLNVPEGMGVIARTATMGHTKAEIKRDLDYLLSAWANLAKRLERGNGPAALYQESDVAIRTVRDLFGPETEAVIVDDADAFKKIHEFAELLMPEQAHRIVEHDGKKPLFHAEGVEQDFEKIFSRRIELVSGGSVVFDQAEALVAIDVNSGKTRTSSHDFEEVAFKTNMEAVPEIARQIRLRDLGGIVVVDFIDMMKNANRRSVEQTFRACFSDDRARSKVGRISQFGLLEMTRQRLGPGMSKKLFKPCTACRGAGRQRTESSRSAAILRRLGSALSLKGFSKIELRAHPETLDYLKRVRSAELKEIEESSGRTLELKGVPDQIEDSVLRYLRADGREVRPGGRRKR